MKVLLVAEGPHEMGKGEEGGALEILIRRLHQGIIQCDLDRVSRKDIHTYHGKGGGYFKRAMGWLLYAKEKEYDALILVIDQDKYPERVQEFTDAQNNNMVSLRRALGVAIRTFDAWMLADEQALTRVLSYVIPRQRNPEEIRGGKGVCAQLLEQSKINMSQSDLYSTVAREADIDTMKERCPQGFAPFAERVSDL